MALDLRVPLDPIFDAFGVPATVTRPVPDEFPIVTTGVWVSPEMVEAALGTDLSRTERQRMLALPTSAVPTVPRGTRIDAPELLGGAVKPWRVDALGPADAEIHRVIVVPDPFGEL